LIEPEELVERIWARDPTVWTGQDEAQWLGWLDEPRLMGERLEELGRLRQSAEDIEGFVLLGMG
jgi:transaldolase/glucose-6-phosphate isomerase